MGRAPQSALSEVEGSTCERVVDAVPGFNFAMMPPVLRASRYIHATSGAFAIPAVPNTRRYRSISSGGPNALE